MSRAAVCTAGLRGLDTKEGPAVGWGLGINGVEGVDMMPRNHRNSDKGGYNE